MNIQSSYGISYYAPATNTGLQASSGKVSTSPPSYLDASSGTTDRVTFSDAAQKIFGDDSGTTQPRTPAQESMLQGAYADPNYAQKLASDMAKGNSQIFYNIRDTPVDQPVNKLSTGRVIDDKFKTNFYAEAAKVDAGRRSIYNAETAKGTDPVEIINKMINFTNSQSRDYLEGRGLLNTAA